jgi:hypothetical protein
MSIIDRAKNILLKPKQEWELIADEPATMAGLFTGYALPLALLPVAAAILMSGLAGISAAGIVAPGSDLAAMGLTEVVGLAVIGYVISIILLFAMAMIIKLVSPSFNGTSNKVQATKLMVYASTPSWVASLVSWIPFLGVLISFAALVYVVYLIYLGIRPVLGVPQEKVAGFTVVIVLIYIVLLMVISGILVGLLFSSMFGNPMMGGALSGA